jgi:adenine-specific DNA-methyltransferase
VDIHYLLGVINSSYTAFAYKKLVREAGRVFPQVKITHVKKLPLAIPPKRKQDEIAMKVKAILETKEKNANADTSILEREIDHLVYALYGLTPDEIRLVEESEPSSGRRAEPAPDSPPLA